MWYVLIKELMRRVNLYKINHLSSSTSAFVSSVLKPLSTAHLWVYNFDYPTNTQLPNSPRTPGWRRMTSEDAPNALALVNKWSSQFEIKQIFTNEADFLYHCPSHGLTYVVENKTNNITDLVSFRFIDVSLCATLITTLVSSQTPTKQLIIDTLVCVKDSDGKSVGLSQHNIKPDVLLSLSFHCIDNLKYFIYNYKYHEVSENEFWCFT